MSSPKQQNSSTTSFAKRFPIGDRAKAELRNLLIKSKNPNQTITEFQKQASLETVFVSDVSTDTNGNASDKASLSNIESVLKFLHHLDSTKNKHYVYNQLITVLRNKLEDLVKNCENDDLLIELLTLSWKVRGYAHPELRMVLVAVFKKLRSKVPSEMLKELAKRKDNNTATKGSLFYQDLFDQLSPQMQSQVYEQDFQASHMSMLFEKTLKQGGESQQGQSLIADFVSPQIMRYCTDSDLAVKANQVFVLFARQRKYQTNIRRMMKIPASKGQTTSEASKALNDIHDIIRKSPILFGAVLGVLVAEHGQLALAKIFRKDDNDVENNVAVSILGGSSYLHCCLAADLILLFQGKHLLPKQYEVLGLLAKTIDQCVNLGDISDDHLARIQGCLVPIFETSAGSKATDVASAEEEVQEQEFMDISNKKRKFQTDEVTSKILRKILKEASKALKHADAQSLFLNPVTDAIAPGYSKIIKKPMCMLTIDKKIEKDEYNSIDDFQFDVQLMFDNCIMYNIGQQGAWFRGEARRQIKIFQGSIIPQATSLLTDKLADKGKTLPGTLDAGNQQKKRKVGLLGLVVNRPEAEKVKTVDVESISKISSKDMNPLVASATKRSMKGATIPSVSSLASMLLSDPFFTRVLFGRLLRLLKNNVLSEKKLPGDYKAIASIMQLLHIAQYSTSVCSVKGKAFTIPGSGLEKGSQGTDIGYTVLRQLTPIVSKLLLEVTIDKRMSVGGDLYDVTVQENLAELEVSGEENWNGVSSFCVVRAIIESVLVDLVQQGHSNEKALALQLRRFEPIFSQFTKSVAFFDDRPFFFSLSNAICSYKTKLPLSVRDMILRMLLSWLKGASKLVKTEDAFKLTYSLHLCTLKMINELAKFGNIVLPLDKLYDLSIEIVKAANGNNSMADFATRFSETSENNCFPKQQYEQLLSLLPDDRAKEWKSFIGIKEVNEKIGE